jgi:membrane associated rhomboid family serine protease
MADRDDPLKEILATGALVLVVGAIIGSVIGAVELGRGSAATAIIAWASAAVGFAVSLAYFMADARKGEEAPAELPFPSWLRTESESVR